MRSRLAANGYRWCQWQAAQWSGQRESHITAASSMEAIRRVHGGPVLDQNGFRQISSTCSTEGDATINHGLDSPVLDTMSSGSLKSLLNNVDAASAAEPLADGVLNPVTLATSAWELSHTLTGLPWWLTIPTTAFALRALLLPLSLKAKGAAVNFSLMSKASIESRTIYSNMYPEEKQATSEQQIRQSLYEFLRKQHNTPSTWWYSANVLVQVNVFAAFSIALRRMCDLAWPGLTSEGAWVLSDLTRIAVDWTTLTCPCGYAGAFIPMLIMYSYLRSLDFTSAGGRRGTRLFLELLSLPIFLAATTMPQAVGIYWLANTGSHYLMQRITNKPSVAQALGLPLVLVRPVSKQEQQEVEKLLQQQARAAVAAGTDPQFLQFLGNDYLRQGLKEAALLCFQKAVHLQPANVGAWQVVGRLKAERADWMEAAAAYSTAAQHMQQGPARAEVMLSAATMYMNAASGTSEDKALDKQKLLKTAQQALASAASHKADDPAVWATTAVCCAALSRLTDALSAVHKALQLQLSPEQADQVAQVVRSCARQLARKEQHQQLAGWLEAAAQLGSKLGDEARQQLKERLQQVVEEAGAAVQTEHVKAALEKLQ